MEAGEHVECGYPEEGEAKGDGFKYVFRAFPPKTPLEGFVDGYPYHEPKG